MRLKNNHRRAAGLLAGTLAALGTAGPAWAQQTVEPTAADHQDERTPARTTDILVTGQTLDTAGPTPLPVVVLSGDALAHRRQGGLGETLAGLPGVHLDSFGGGASRPVIRGQTVPRIEVLSDGANLFDVSSVSPDHAITTDPLLLDAIEVQRGPAAVRYGGNAVNGAINLIDGKVPRALPANGLSGATELRYGTGDEETSLVGRVTAGVGQFAIHAEGVLREAGDYAVPAGFGSDRLRDSFAEGSSYAVGASWITAKGYIGGAYARMDSEYGLPGHSHANGVCHNHGDDLHCESHDEFGDPFVGSDDNHTAYIDLRSERADVRADYRDLLPGIERARLRLSYTDYVHDEIDGPFLFSRYTNQVYDGRLELTHKPLLGFTGILGGQYTEGTFSGLNFNDAHEDGEADPFYSQSIAVFLNERRSFGAVDVEIAGRHDWRKIDATYPSYEVAIGLSREYVVANLPNFVEMFDKLYQDWFVIPPAEHNLLSLSASADWKLGQGFSAALMVGQTERAPSVRELYANGNNLATNSYEVGLLRSGGEIGADFPSAASDITERTRSIDLTLRKAGGPLEFEVGLFHQNVDNYVFAQFLGQEDETGIPHNFLVYTAADARFSGIDGQISYRVSPTALVTVFGDYVDAKLKNQNDNLPRIPPGRLGARYEHTAGPISGDVEYYHTFAQEKFASYETRTAGYDMLNATLSYRLDVGTGKTVELYMRGTNLLNELAYAHTSFVKLQSPLRGRSVAFGMRHAF